MAKQPAKARLSITQVRLGAAQFELACYAMFLDSVAKSRFSSLRPVVVCGLDLVIRATQYERFLLLKNRLHEPHRPHVVHLNLLPEERTLLSETRQLLQRQHLEELSNSATVVVALMAAIKASPPINTKVGVGR